MESITGVRRGTFDQLFVRDTNQDLINVLSLAGGSTDLTAVETRLTAVEGVNTAQDTTIAGKQDSLTSLSAGTQVSLLNGTLLKPLQPGSNITLTDAGTHVVLASSGGGSGVAVTAPLTLNGNTVGLDMSSAAITIGQLTVATDITCVDLQANTLYGPAAVQITANTQAQISTAIATVEPGFVAADDIEKRSTASGPELGFKQTFKDAITALQAGTLTGQHVNCTQLTCTHDITAGDVTCLSIQGGAGVQIANNIATQVATREPAFQTSAELTKTLNVPTGVIELGFSAATQTRLNGFDTSIAAKEPAFQTTTDLVKTLNLGAGTIELGISSTLEARIAALEAAINPFFCAGVLYPNGTIRISKGRVGFTVATSGGGADYAITFAQSYGSLNYVAVCCSSQWHDIVGGRTATSFTLYVRGSANQNVNNADISFIVV